MPRQRKLILTVSSVRESKMGLGKLIPRPAETLRIATLHTERKETGFSQLARGGAPL